MRSRRSRGRYAVVGSYRWRLRHSGGGSAEVAPDARRLVEDGFEVIYFKVGRGDALDLDTAAKIREAIGP